jgi:ubiquinone/menaquinone biosynthesis C-methylase UbiE
LEIELSSSSDFAKQSKRLHAAYEKEFWRGAFDIMHPDTARHYEMLSTAIESIDAVKPSSILTIGDNLARDGGFLKKHWPDARVVATDLRTESIQQAAVEGFVDQVLDADVEALPFHDSSFDVVFAKEAFHHWPRPMLGFYEMLRVARKAVVLIEPNDVQHSVPKPYLQEGDYTDRYEDVGNFVYQISAREVIKAAWSLYLPAVSIMGFNDPYDPAQDIKAWRKIKQELDSLGESGERQFNLLTIAVFKLLPDENCFNKEKGTRLFYRPKNPFHQK